MDEPGRKATNSPAAALGEMLEPLRPWSDQERVEAVLRSWIRSRGRSPDGDIDVAAEVAPHLRVIGAWRDSPDSQTVASMAGFLILNVLAGRDVRDDGPVVAIQGLSERTARDDRSRHGDDAARVRLRRIQHDLDVVELVRKGRTATAARQWLRQHPGEHAFDAPPPRRRKQI